MINLGGAARTGVTGPVSIRFYGINAEAADGTFSIASAMINGLLY